MKTDEPIDIYSINHVSRGDFVEYICNERKVSFTESDRGKTVWVDEDEIRQWYIKPTEDTLGYVAAEMLTPQELATAKERIAGYLAKVYSVKSKDVHFFHTLREEVRRFPSADAKVFLIQELEKVCAENAIIKQRERYIFKWKGSETEWDYNFSAMPMWSTSLRAAAGAVYGRRSSCKKQEIRVITFKTPKSTQIALTDLALRKPEILAFDGETLEVRHCSFFGRVKTARISISSLTFDEDCSDDED